MKTWADCGRMLAAVLSNLSIVERGYCLSEYYTSYDLGLVTLVGNGRTVLNHIHPCFEPRPFPKFVLFYVNNILPLSESLVLQPSSFISADKLLAPQCSFFLMMNPAASSKHFWAAEKFIRRSKFHVWHLWLFFEGPGIFCRSSCSV